MPQQGATAPQAAAAVGARAAAAVGDGAALTPAAVAVGNGVAQAVPSVDGIGARARVAGRGGSWLHRLVKTHPGLVPFVS